MPEKIMVHYESDDNSKNNIIPFTEGIRKVRIKKENTDPLEYFGEDRLYEDTKDEPEVEFLNTNRIIESKVDQLLMDKLNQYRDELVEADNNITPFQRKRKYK